jgi:hypothetical protein
MDGHLVIPCHSMGMGIPWEWEARGFPKKSWIDDHPQFNQYTIQPDHATSWNEDPEKIPTLLRWINVDKYDK